MTTTPVDANLLFALGCSALRYALPRRSYAGGMVADAITERLALFGVNDLTRMAREIDEAIRDDLAGDAPDVARWERLARDLREEVARR